MNENDQELKTFDFVVEVHPKENAENLGPVPVTTVACCESHARQNIVRQILGNRCFVKSIKLETGN